MKEIENNVLLTITSKHLYADSDEYDISDMNLKGNLQKKDDSLIISYTYLDTETSINLYTTITIHKNKVTMRRLCSQNKSSVYMVMDENSEKTISEHIYGDTALTFGISSVRIKNNLTVNGGDITVFYNLDNADIHISKNTVKISVKLIKNI